MKGPDHVPNSPYPAYSSAAAGFDDFICGQIVNEAALSLILRRWAAVGAPRSSMLGTSGTAPANVATPPDGVVFDDDGAWLSEAGPVDLNHPLRSSDGR